MFFFTTVYKDVPIQNMRLCKNLSYYLICRQKLSVIFFKTSEDIDMKLIGCFIFNT